MAEVKQRWDWRRLFWRPRFSLWAMLVLITVVAIPLSYVAQRRSWNLRRAAARRELEEAGLFFVPLYQRPKMTGLRGFWDDMLLEDFDHIYAVRDRPEEVDKEIDELPIDLSGLRYFPEIMQLQIENRSAVTDESLAVVQFLPRIEYLHLAHLPKVTGRFLAFLSNPEKMIRLRLEKLHSLNSSELRMIGRMEQLARLEIVDCPSLTDDSLSDVTLPPELNLLCVWGSNLGDATLGHWLDDCKLRELSIQARVSRGIAPHLAKQTELESLQIANAPLLDEDFAFLANCIDLYDLQLCGMPINGELLKWIPESNLIYLDLSSTLMRDDHLEQLGRLTKLESLDLSWTPITGEGFRPEPRWKELSHFYLAGTRFSEAGKQRLSTLDVSGVGPGLDLPSNWSHDDLKRYRSEHFPGSSLSEREAKVQLSETGKSFSHPTKELSLRQEPLNNFPKELMAPVLRLHQLARTESTEED